MVMGTLRRVMVSISPAVNPKLPSPITATVFACGRPTCAPTAADMEYPSAP